MPIPIPEEQAVELPVDQLGLIVLRDFAREGWNQNNYVREAEQYAGYGHEGSRALAEAFGWLRARGLVASDPSQSSPDAIFVTRTGQRVLEDGPDSFYATERLQRGSLHLAIENEARPQFLIGKFELGVFAALKAVEVRVRKLGG
jgi:hypothetical protein